LEQTPQSENPRRVIGSMTGSITPTATPVIKAHKPEKDYPARLITSHIGAPQEALASHLNTILKPYIENNKYVCKNSFDFVENIKHLKLGPLDKMVSYDATALFPSVPIQECTALINDYLKKDNNLPSRTKLSPDDITDLISLCLSSSNFVYDNRHHTQDNSGPIGLSLMVTISQLWMTHTIEKAIHTAESQGSTIPRHLTVYMDDCWGIVTQRRPGLRSSSNMPDDPATDFQNHLNLVHPRVQFTREEEVDKSIAFLDVHLTREENGKISTKVHRKPSNTNLTIKPNSCQDKNTVIAIFKGELCRAHRLCSSPASFEESKRFLLNLFEDNGHKREQLETIANTYTPPTLLTTKDKKQNKTKNKQNTEKTPDNLFDILPFKDTDISDEEKKPFARIPFIPGGISYKLKRSLKKAGVNTLLTAGTKLKNLLCTKNKTHPPKTSKKGVYKIDCTCNPKCKYIGQTSRSIDTRMNEHRKAVEKEKWTHSGITQHKETCKATVDWENPTVITTMSNKSKNKLVYDLKIREALEIKHHDSGPGRGLNEDYGAYVKTTAWNPVFHHMDQNGQNAQE